MTDLTTDPAALAERVAEALGDDTPPHHATTYIGIGGPGRWVRFYHGDSGTGDADFRHHLYVEPGAGRLQMDAFYGRLRRYVDLPADASPEDIARLALAKVDEMVAEREEERRYFQSLA